MDQYAVLLFRDQDITDEQQLAFARNFGERENARGGTVTKKQDYRLTSGLNDVSNLGKDGKPLSRDHRTHLFNLGKLPVAFRQLVPCHSGEVFAVVGARREPEGAATPNSPTCAPPMTHSTTKPKSRSRI